MARDLLARDLLALTLVLLLGLPAVAGEAPSDEAASPPPPPPVVALVLDGAVAARDAALEAGARLALDRAADAGLPVPRLLVVRAGGAWDDVGRAAVRAIRGDGAIALVAPPSARVAHLLAQIGTKGHVPVLSTARAPSVTGAGSWWVVPVVPLAASSADREQPTAPQPDGAAAATRAFLQAWAARHGEEREPPPWAAAGHDALLRVAHALATAEDPPLRGRALAHRLHDPGDLPAPAPVHRP